MATMEEKLTGAVICGTAAAILGGAIAGPPGAIALGKLGAFIGTKLADQ